MPAAFDEAPPGLQAESAALIGTAASASIAPFANERLDIGVPTNGIGVFDASEIFTVLLGLVQQGLHCEAQINITVDEHVYSE